MRVGILGAGTMGRTHAAAYAGMDDVEIVGIVGRTPDKVQEAAGPLGIPGLTDPYKVLDDGSVDAVDVCYPTSAHREYAVAALDRGKHVLCEVPLARTLEDADAMIAAARSRGKLLLVAPVARFVGSYAHIRETVRSGQMGRPLLASIAIFFPPDPRWLQRPAPELGDMAVELMTHQFIYLGWLLGQPAAVRATGLVGPTGDVEHAFAALEYGEAYAQVEEGTLMPASYPFSTHLRVLCAGGVLETSFRSYSPERWEASLVCYPQDGEVYSPEFVGPDPYWAECRYFVDCVAGRADPARMSAAAGRDALQVALAAKESLKRGGERVALM